MAQVPPTICFGAAGVFHMTTELLVEMLDTLQKHDVKEMDTAFIYKESEEILGKVDAAKSFTISTKAPGFKAGSLTKQSVLDGIGKSLRDLGVNSVDIYYLHAPDPSIPLEETLSAIQEIYAAGKFKRFGISNYRPQDVQKIYDIQLAAKSVLPTVFQGNYNAISRHIETDLFPLLRELNISFYAYSPIAGGFLVKTPGVEEGTRFGPNARTGNMYKDMYGKESLYAALKEWGVIANDAGVSKAALAYRWIAFHSALKKEHGDALIIGASKVSQVEETLLAIEAGPLDNDIAKRVDAIWKTVENEAPLDNYHSFANTLN